MLAWRADRSRTMAWLFGVARLCGTKLFIVLTRFSTSQPTWIARSTLEPVFILPALIAAAFIGEAVGTLSRQSAALGVVAAALLPAAALAARVRRCPSTATTFSPMITSAICAARCRRAGRCSPRATRLRSGSRWLDLVEPEERLREIPPPRRTNGRRVAGRACGTERTCLVTGLSLTDLRAMGLPSEESPFSAGRARFAGRRASVANSSYAQRPCVIRACLDARRKLRPRHQAFLRFSPRGFRRGYSRPKDQDADVPSERLDLAAVSDDPGELPSPVIP